MHFSAGQHGFMQFSESLRQRPTIFRDKTQSDLPKFISETLDSLIEPFFIFSHNGILVYLNKSAEPLFKNPSRLLGKNVIKAWSRLNPLLPRKFEQCVIKQSPLQMEINLEGKWYNVHFSPSPNQVSAQFFDISSAHNSLESEQDAVRMERLSLVGDTAANIGHEMRNPLTTARGYLQLLGESTEGKPLRNYFNIIISELDHANSILSDFLLLSKNKSVELIPQELNSIIEDNHPLLQAMANKEHKLVVTKLDSIPPLNLDEKEISKLIVNLTLNGLEAMKPGGTVTISTRAEGDQVILSVQDTGKGIPPHLHETLGIPFLTTKDSGTGLGLAVCYSIAARHNATLSYFTGSQGTTIDLRFNVI